MKRRLLAFMIAMSLGATGAIGAVSAYASEEMETENAEEFIESENTTAEDDADENQNNADNSGQDDVVWGENQGIPDWAQDIDIGGPEYDDGEYEINDDPFGDGSFDDDYDEGADGETEETEHVWNDGEVITPATCQTVGTIKYTCTICSETKTEDIPLAEHTEAVSKEGTPATLFTTGLTEEIICSVCSEIIQEQEEIPMKDLSATLSNGMSGDEVKEVQEKLAELGYLTSEPDGIYDSQTEVAVRDFQLVNGLGYSDGMVGNWTLNALRNNPVSKPEESELSPERVLRQGMKGSDVFEVQKRLYELGYLTVMPDGNFGAKTKAAVNEFQIANGLGYSDGMVGKWTISKLNNNPLPKITVNRVLSKGMTGTDVLSVQERLYVLGYLSATPDGIFGSLTEAAINAFQMSNGLGYCDGMVGKWTTSKMNNSPLSKLVLSRVLSKGMTGDDVLELQKHLSVLGYLTATPDGQFGSKTRYAVNIFQIANGLGYSDGKAGNWTASKISTDPILKSNIPSSIVTTRTLSTGMSGDDVLAVQKVLTKLGYLYTGSDGYFGSYTNMAVREFQYDIGISVSGVVDSATLEAINIAASKSVSYISPGDVTYAQSLAANEINKLGTSLYNAFIYACQYPYGNYEIGSVKYSYLPEIASANYFVNSWGDCYCMSSTFYMLAKSLGYDAHVVIGQVPLRSGVLGAHSWVEIDYSDGTTYVYDPQFHNQYGYGGWEFSYGDSGTWRYSKTTGRIN